MAACLVPTVEFDLEPVAARERIDMVADAVEIRKGHRAADGDDQDIGLKLQVFLGHPLGPGEADRAGGDAGRGMHGHDRVPYRSSARIAHADGQVSGERRRALKEQREDDEQDPHRLGLGPRGEARVNRAGRLTEPGCGTFTQQRAKPGAVYCALTVVGHP